MHIRSLLPALVCLAPLAAWAGPVDINTADEETLARELKGIGLARARAIVAYRAEHGPFRSADDLALVKGVGQKVIDENRENILVGSSGTGAPERAAGTGTEQAEKSNAPTDPRR